MNNRTLQDAFRRYSCPLNAPSQADCPGLHVFITAQIDAIDAASDGDIFIIFTFAPIFIIIPSIKGLLTDTAITGTGEFVVITIGTLVDMSRPIF
jgi:hypothetical protein